MKKFLFISSNGDSISLAQRIKNEGHDILYYINGSKYVQVGDGVVEKAPISDPIITDKLDRKLLDNLLIFKPDCIIIDSSKRGFGWMADVLRREKWNVIGSSLFSEEVENDDSYLEMLFNYSGIKVPTPQLDIAHPDQYVEITTEGWFNGKELLGLTHSMDEMNLMEHRIGPFCTGMGSLTFKVNPLSRLYNEGLMKLIPFLRKSTYKGPISLCSLVFENDSYGIAVIARPKFPSAFTFFENAKVNVGSFLHSLNDDIMFKAPFSIGVSIVVKPFPLNIPQRISQNLVMEGLEEGNLKHLWLRDIYRVNKTEYFCAGTSGNLGCVTARGENLREAQKRAYRTIKNLYIPEVMYRRDIGLRFIDDFAKLKKWGWI